MFRYRVVGTVRNALGVATVCIPFVLTSCGEKAEETAAPTGAVATLDRTVLPIAEPPVVSITEVDARKATPPARFEVKAPDSAPNVVIVLIDDIGFGTRGRSAVPSACRPWRSSRTADCASTDSIRRRCARRRGLLF